MANRIIPPGDPGPAAERDRAVRLPPGASPLLLAAARALPAGRDADGRHDAPDDLNGLLPGVAAWSRLRARTACDWLTSALDRGDEDGALHRFPGHASTPAEPVAAWPLLAQAALRAAEAAAFPPAFTAETAEGLRTYLGWAVRRFDPEGQGRPRWTVPEEAFIPDAWDEDLAPVDLAAFLLIELDSLDRLAQQAGLDPEDDPRIPPRYRDQLATHLLRFLWDAEQRRFTDRYLDGRRSNRLTLGTLIPLGWRPLPSAQREALRLRLRSGSPLLSEDGPFLWEPWPDDPEPPPTPHLEQAVLLAATDTMPTVYETLAASLRQVLRRQLDAVTEGEPIELATPALAVLVETGPDPERDYAGTPGWIRWVDRRSRLLLRLGTIVLLLFALLLLALPRFFPSSGEGPAIEALAGLADNHYRQGRYDEADALYREILRRQRIPIVHFRLGNALFRRGEFDQAEAQYRAAMRHRELEPQLLFNLAQVMLRQGREAEAREHLEQVLSTHGTRYPDIAVRAAHALRLLDRASTRGLLVDPHPPNPTP